MNIIILLALFLLPGFAIAQGSAEIDRVRSMMQHNSGNTTNFLLLADRFEYQRDGDDSSLTWDAQAWIGKDLNRLWIKSGGEDSRGKAGASDETESELQLLYSHAIAPFWDLQLGYRHDFRSDEDQDYAVVGLQGLAPYWFEIDLAAYFSDEGDVSSSLEIEYDLYFTQRLILQPRAEFNYSFSSNKPINLGQGMNEASFGLRLRYEYTRSFAPYIGVNWSHAYGETAELLTLTGDDLEDFSGVFGVRFWY